MSRPLTPPGEELARRLLAPVPYRDRFPAGRLRPPVGVTPGDVRSLPELHGFLAPDDASLPGMNLSAMPAWIGGVIGDAELAQRVEAAVRGAESYVDGCLRVRDVLGQRLDQARDASRPLVA